MSNPLLGAGVVNRLTGLTGGGVTQITAGTNVTISPSGGTGNVTINASGGGSSYTFADSLHNSSGTVTLVNDASAPGDDYYYGTNASGTKGFFTLPSGAGLAIGDAVSGGGAYYVLSEDGSQNLAASNGLQFGNTAYTGYSNSLTIGAGGGGGNVGILTIMNADSGSVSLAQSIPGEAYGNTIFQLPYVDGSAGQALLTDGAKNWYFGTAGAGIGLPISSGTSGSVLYIDSRGNLAQNNPGLTYDGTTFTSGDIAIQSTDGNNLLIAGTSYGSATTSTDGVQWILTYNATGNRQITMFDSGQVNTNGFGFRYIVGWPLPTIDAINGYVTTIGNINLGGNGGYVGVGFDVASATQASVQHQLDVNGDINGIQYYVDGTAGFNGTVTPVTSITVVQGIVTAVS